jgi:hypothetical protein
MMIWPSTEHTAFELISVHGREALDVAEECVRVLLRRSDVDGVYTWLTVVNAIQENLRAAA